MPSPTPKISLIDSAWLMMRPSAGFSGSFGRDLLVKIGDLGKKGPLVLDKSGVGRWTGSGRCLLGRPGLDCRAILGVCGGHQSDLCMRESA